MGKLKGVKK